MAGPRPRQKWTTGRRSIDEEINGINGSPARCRLLLSTSPPPPPPHPPPPQLPPTRPSSVTPRLPACRRQTHSRRGHSSRYILLLSLPSSSSSNCTYIGVRPTARRPPPPPLLLPPRVRLSCAYFLSHPLSLFIIYYVSVFECKHTRAHVHGKFCVHTYACACVSETGFRVIWSRTTDGYTASTAATAPDFANLGLECMRPTRDSLRRQAGRRVDGYARLTQSLRDRKIAYRCNLRRRPWTHRPRERCTRDAVVDEDSVSGIRRCHARRGGLVKIET